MNNSITYTPYLDNSKPKYTDLKTILRKYLFHWPLFLVFLIIGFTLAIVYLQLAKPIYEIKATLIISADKNQNSQKPSAFQEIDVLNSQKVVENEMEIIKSKQLINQVTDELGLNTVYFKKSGFKTEDLYEDSPVKATLLQATGNYKQNAVTIIINNEKTFFIVNPNGSNRLCNFNSILSNGFGNWKLEPTVHLNKYKNSKLTIQFNDPDKTIAQYQNELDVSLADKQASTVYLSLSDQNIQRGKDVLNHVISAYNNITLEQKNKEVENTLKFLNNRIGVLAGELASAEKGIQNFKSSKGLTDISSDSKVSLENMQANDARLNEVNVQLSVIKGIEDYINSPENSSNVPATLGITDPSLVSLVEKLSQLQLQRERLLATTPETNPDFEPINRQIAITKSAIKESVRNIKSSLVSTEAKLQSYNSKYESSIKEIPVDERQYVDIKRLQSSKESLYTYLLQKREELSLSFTSTLAEDRVVDNAYYDSKKYPKPPLAFAIAIMFGLGVPTGLIYSRSKLNDRIINADDITSKVKIPIISELTLESAAGTVLDYTNISAFTEQFRALRTKLFYTHGNSRKGRVTLITSSVAEEGKSYVSCNLAAALRHAGRKTIILEMDLHKPTVAKKFNLPQDHAGISEFLRGQAGLSDIIQEIDSRKNLYLIASGDYTNNSSDLLEGSGLQELIALLKKDFDDVIIDSPPVHLVADAMIISQFVDITLYIIRQGLTKKAELDFLKDLHIHQQLNNPYIVFNGIERKRYGYGYNYDNSYYRPNNKATALPS